MKERVEMKFSMSYVFGLSCLAFAMAGCQMKDSGAEATQATHAVFNSGGNPTVELSVPEMMCENSCAQKVKEVLAEQSGVVDVKVDFPNRKAFVAIQPASFDSKAAITELEDCGFKDTQVVAEHEASPPVKEESVNPDPEG